MFTCWCWLMLVYTGRLRPLFNTLICSNAQMFIWKSCCLRVFLFGYCWFCLAFAKEIFIPFSAFCRFFSFGLFMQCLCLSICLERFGLTIDFVRVMKKTLRWFATSGVMKETMTAGQLFRWFYYFNFCNCCSRNFRFPWWPETSEWTLELY